ncbi:MAG: hypothetical protein P8Y53_22465, partial [Pseudolabrys sp.]
MRLRADILWAAKHWQKAAEQIELLYGDRWRQFRPLSAAERVDILRAAIGYALAGESIGLARFRDRYMAKMADSPDAHAFKVVTAPVGSGDPEFSSVAQTVAGIDTLDAFLKDMRKRYPAPDAVAPQSVSEKQAPKPAPSTQPAKPAAKTAAKQAGKTAGAQKSAANNKPPAGPASPSPPGKPLRPDATPTGAIPQSSQGGER